MKTSRYAAFLSLSLALPSGAQTVIPVEAKVDSSTGQLLIPAEFDGAKLWCSLDSGFSALIAIDQTDAQRIGLRTAPGMPTPDGRPPSPGDSSSTATLTVGGVRFGRQSLILRRFAGEAPETGCIMGVGVLKGFVVELDYARDRLRLHDRAAYGLPRIFRKTAPLSNVLTTAVNRF